MARIFNRNAVGERLRAAREARGLKQLEVATQVGTRSGDVSGWERGKFLPNAASLAYLSLTLGVSTDWILFGDD